MKSEHMKTETIYSTDGETFNHTDIEEAARELWDGGDYSDGEIAILYEADGRTPLASEFLLNIADDITERACVEYGEWAEMWSFSSNQRMDLQATIEQALDEWATKNDMHPDFWKVEHDREVKIQFTDDEGNFKRL